PQVTLARMREFGIRPDRDLGQHFLVDDNVLEVAGRLLPLEPDDVVLEVGAGLGVLTAWLARRVALVHAVEIDRRLEPALTSRVVHAAFSHRRKTLGNSLALAGLPGPPIDVAGMRAEQLPPERLAALARELR